MSFISQIRRSIETREAQAAAIRAHAAEKVAEAIEADAQATETPDDLTAIRGIGAKVAAKLNAAGICTFADLAAATAEQLDAAQAGLSKKAAAGDWAAKASTLAPASSAKEKETEITADALGLGLASRLTGLDLYCALDLDQTDIDLAKRMLARYDGRLMYVEGLGTLAWSGRRWQLEEKGDAPLLRASQDTIERMSFEAAVVRTAYEMERAIHADAIEAGEHRFELVEHYCIAKSEAKDLRAVPNTGAVYCHEELVARARAVKSHKAIKAVASIATNYMVQPQNTLDAQPSLLTVANGTVDLRTGEVFDCKPEHFITKASPVAVPTVSYGDRRFVAYDAAKAPTWCKAIDEAMLGDADLVSYLQRLSGYIITGETQEQKFFFLHGSGSNMKGKFVGTLSRLIPEHTKEVEKDLLMKQRGMRKEMGGTNEAVADLRAVRMIHAEEGDADDVLDEANMKRLSGQGKLKAAKKYKAEIEFTPEGKIVYDTNTRPRIFSQDKAIWRRVVEIPFKAHFANPGDEGFVEGFSKKKNAGLDRDLTAELPQILAWAIEGAKAWYAADGGKGSLGEEPAAVKAAREAYKTDTDVLADFLQDACDNINGIRVLAGDLYRAYCNHCELNAAGRPISSIAFGKALEERGYPKEKRGGKMYRTGLSLSKAGRCYLENKRPDDEPAVAPVERFEYRIGNGIATVAHSLADLPDDVRRIITAHTGGRAPAKGTSLMTNQGLFEALG